MKRIAVIDRDVCIKEKCGYVCMNVCPVNRMGEECIVIEEETGYPVISEELCIGCGICVKKCPVQCIDIINLTKELPPLTYSYGINAFRVHGIALPKEEGIIGFIGKNGIGKTTIIKILSGELKAENIEKLSIEAREYLENIGKKRLSVKPQYVEKLRSNVKVGQLLEKMGIRIEEFEHLKDRRLNELSGGELQKLAIKIALSKEADLYFLDEITNFLDIGERLKTALEIKKFQEEKKKGMIIVEHDLAIVDYLSDYIYIFYGEEDVYGVVSGIKPVRNGINEYLEGYLKAENLRFRDYKISFSLYSEKEAPKEIFQSYPEMEIKVGDFKLRVEGGEIRKGEVIGIVGKNGIGKTTFIKSLVGLVGEEKPLEGIKVSYKPQYLSFEDVYVKEVLSKGDKAIVERAKQLLSIKPSIMEKKLTNISGGELQRVAIALALSQKADIILLDEPTAYLDIEQRVSLAELLKSITTEFEIPIFVVDHDIVFLDRVSSRIIRFEGSPGKEGTARKPEEKREGMNKFLESLNITLRRDKDSLRPRINKPGSVVDREQREKGNYFY